MTWHFGYFGSAGAETDRPERPSNSPVDRAARLCRLQGQRRQRLFCTRLYRPLLHQWAHLAWIYKTPSSNPWVQGILASAPDWDLVDAEPKLTYSVGQSMYSPRDVSVATPQPPDRSWGCAAGNLHVHGNVNASLIWGSLTLNWDLT